MTKCVLVLSALALLCVASGAADGALKIGVFDQSANGGRGGQVDRLVKDLNRIGYEAEAIRDLRMLTLLQYDILYLSDMHSPGRVHETWRKTLKQFVEDGGSVLQTWHHHILGEVGVGILRIYGSRRMIVQPGHPAVEGVKDFDAAYKDHIIERVGPNATVLLKNDQGRPVAVAGKIGKGKVISTGLPLGMPDGRRARLPRGEALKLLKSFLKWLAPDVPRGERLARALKTPQLMVVPPEVLAAAGFPALFEIRVGVGEAGQDVRVSCGEGEITAKPSIQAAAGPSGVIRRYDLVVRTEPGVCSEKECAVRAIVGDKVLEESIKVTSVYGTPPPNERRGVWLHVAAEKHPKIVMPELKRLGVNFAVLRIAGGTAAFFGGSKVQPDIQDPLAPEGDWLAESVRYAHENGIEMHPYVNNCVVEGRTSPKTMKRLRDAGRLQVGPGGEPINWFCPSQEVNLKHMEEVMVEIATKYDADGVQYDFIRYPNARGCFCPKCRALFEQETGKPVADWPKDVLKDGARHAEWVEFRCRRISALVERTSNRIHKEAPGVKISAAVFRNWPGCREENGQDWVRWCKEGWLDFVCPMNYTLDPKAFAERAAIHRKALPTDFPIVQGIGTKSGAGGMKTPQELAVQIAIARQNGSAGFVCFCYTPKQTSALFAPLREWLGVK